MAKAKSTKTAAKTTRKRVGSLLSAPREGETVYRAATRTARGVCKGETTKSDVSDAIALLRSEQKSKIEAIEAKHKASVERIREMSNKCKTKK